MDTVLLSVSALASLVPASLQTMRRTPDRDVVFWAVLAVAVAGPVAWVVANASGAWRTELANALWATVAATMAIYAVTAVTTRQGWRLMPLMAPYMLLLGIIATVWLRAPGQPLAEITEESGWIGIHIAVSVTTYAVLTIAAVAALAAFLQERALKRKRPTALTRALPSVADCETLVVRLLIVGEIILAIGLAIGLATGMALQYGADGTLISLDHKTVLMVAAFVVIGGLLFAHYASGIRGRQAARVVLLAYLLMTLGYPGVKFVTDVLMA